MQLLKKHPAISEETFLELIDAKKDSFYRVAYSYTRHREDALDVVSESVCKAYTHLHHLTDPDSFYPWFYRILSNTALPSSNGTAVSPHLRTGTKVLHRWSKPPRSWSCAKNWRGWSRNTARS